MHGAAKWDEISTTLKMKLTVTHENIVKTLYIEIALDCNNRVFAGNFAICRIAL
jgi:hypothetical protein